MNYKVYFILFILFVLITSQSFMDIVLTKFNDTTEIGTTPNTYGRIIQGIVFVLLYILIFALMDYGLL